ncbi:four and a half LIM domains protein 2 isoform X1 [Rousettus aegyptiacus]|uniref:four and a half LIM domains protein 2 isoform X1 n=1 Tax=Rousettus aegyptiacus TaxID=9407 RepID=UPI00168D8F08|nr:four and a half LIM domains protein 2 isoform X1 [Rousettus aegyptiacus]
MTRGVRRGGKLRSTRPAREPQPGAAATSTAARDLPPARSGSAVQPRGECHRPGLPGRRRGFTRAACGLRSQAVEETPRQVVEKPGVKMTERFDCHHCEESLFGKKYILREDSPYCVACFETLYASTCEECRKPIGCDCKDLSYKDRHWHEACFHCSRCKSSLVDKPFAAKEDQLLCTDCYSHEYSSKCQECKKTIMPGTRKMEYKGSSWHETCFICHRCQQPIGTKSFIPKDDQNFCVPCYEKQYALQCVQCKKPITTGGVTYREQPWHRECFVCTACKKPLSGQRFTSRDEFAYCLSCFCDLYAKKCAGCTNPISGLGGTKYISFEERQWHNDCFNCKKCSLSLVGRGFLTERDDILCPDCGKDI